MKLIPLTDTLDRPFWLNAAHIRTGSRPSGKDFTLITLRDRKECEVQETPEEVVELCS